MKIAHLVNKESGKRCANHKPFAHPTLAVFEGVQVGFNNPTSQAQLLQLKQWVKQHMR